MLFGRLQKRSRRTARSLLLGLVTSGAISALRLGSSGPRGAIFDSFLRHQLASPSSLAPPSRDRFDPRRCRIRKTPGWARPRYGIVHKSLRSGRPNRLRARASHPASHSLDSSIGPDRDTTRIGCRRSAGLHPPPRPLNGRSCILDPCAQSPTRRGGRQRAVPAATSQRQTDGSSRSALRSRSCEHSLPPLPRGPRLRGSNRDVDSYDPKNTVRGATQCLAQPASTSCVEIQRSTLSAKTSSGTPPEPRTTS